MTWNEVKKKAGRVFFWLLFSVLFGCLPLGFTALDLMYHDQTVDWMAVIGKGELLLISCGLAGASLGDLIFLNTKRRLLRSAIALFAVSVAATSTFIFGLISENLRNNAELPEFGVTFSVWVFGVSLVVGITTIIFSDDGTI